jgi:hypothetical protein
MAYGAYYLSLVNLDVLSRVVGLEYSVIKAILIWFAIIAVIVAIVPVKILLLHLKESAIPNRA